MDKSTDNLGKRFRKSDSEIENQQDIVSLEVKLEDSKDENNDNHSNIRALPYSFVLVPN